MGDWGEDFEALLNGEASEIRDPGDISLVLDRDFDYWHPAQVRDIEEVETVERQPIGDMNKDIATAYEQHFATDYQSQKVDSGPMDVRITLAPKAHNWPVQVKSCNALRKAGDGTRTGAFKFREWEYPELPESSFLQFYVGQVFFDDDRDFKGDVIYAENDETGREAYVEKLGQMLVPKAVFEEYFEPEWSDSGYWNLNWTDVFGEVPADSPFFDFTFEKYADQNGTENYQLADFGDRSYGRAGRN
jgi:hypothetical protein